MIDRNKIWEVKNKLENYYGKFKKHHQLLLNLLEDADYISNTNSDEFHKILDEYEKDTLIFDEVFSLFDEHERQIKLLVKGDVGVLKKKREDILTRISSQMKSNDYDDDLPF